MRVCLPTTGDRGMKETVYNHFGSAGFFTIYDTELETLSVLKNGNEHHQHGQCNPLAQIAQYNVDAVLTNGMGKRAVQKLNDGGVKVFLVDGETVEEALQKFQSEELSELTMDSACGGHSHAHGIH
jgi:predicted Fe-Mo cluster-binding NifX family protein